MSGVPDGLFDEKATPGIWQAVTIRICRFSSAEMKHTLCVVLTHGIQWYPRQKRVDILEHDWIT